MRDRFNKQLLELYNKLIEMGALIERAISRATNALEKQDVDEAQATIAGDDVIDEMEKEIESQCYRLLLIQQPVARDFGLVSTALKMITDMERIGDHAADISALSMNIPKHNQPKTMEYVKQMASATTKMVTESIDSFVKKDLELAHNVIGHDDVVDKLFRMVKKDLIALVHENADNGEYAFDLLQIAKYYERIGDHAVNIAEWVIFSITGRHKDKQIL